MDDINITLTRHEQQIIEIEKSMEEFKQVQSEIRSMNETLVVLATELKRTNEHLVKNEQKIDDINRQPQQRLQQIITVIIAALAGCAISTIANMIS